MKTWRTLQIIITLIAATAVACTPPGPPPAPAAAVDVTGKSAAELQQALSAGELSSETITEACLARIAKIDPQFRAVLVLNPNAVEMARTLDEERADGQVRGPLHGIPVLLKDNIESLDPVATTAGSLALAENITGRDAFVTAQLRQAGAVILGKANLSEWANFRSERSSSGWSGVVGQTRNPHDPTRSPCGSSSGSGVAVAAEMVPLALGTETNGSVVCPATSNGIVGIKPTVGLVSRSGIVPISHSQDTAGPMARTVEDAVMLLDAMIGVDEQDAATEVASLAAGWTLSEHLRSDGAKGKRIGVVRSLAGFHSDVDALLEAAIDDLKEEGAAIIDDLSFDRPDGFGQASYDVLLYEFKSDLNDYLAGLPDPALSALTLEDLIAFNDEHSKVEMPHFGQEIFHKAQAKGPLTEPEYLEALALVQSATREAGIDRLIREHKLDALIAPTGAPAWKIDLIDGDHFLGGSSTYPAVAGYPNITVPMGQVQGIPVGLSFFGPALSEPTLIEIAYGYEQATGHRVRPAIDGD